MVKKRKPGRPKGSKNKIIQGLKEAIEFAQGKDNGSKITTFEYIKDYPSTASFRSRLEAATAKFEQAINETIEQLKGKI